VPSPAPTAEPAPLVTVVVVSRNGADPLPPCLEALAAQDLPRGRVQVWVVDNASGDGTCELVERDFPWVRLFANQRDEGFAGGGNVAMRQADTAYVALLDQDARPARDWLRRLLEPFEEEARRGGGGPRLAATTSKVVFLPRFLPLSLSTPAFVPAGTLGTRELGVRVHSVRVDGRDVTGEVLWDRRADGPEGEGEDRFRWTRPSERLLVPVDPDGNGGARTTGWLQLGLRLAAESSKPVELTWAEGGATIKAGTEAADQEVSLAPGAELVDVLSNAGGMVLVDGHGADRGHQEVDRGQYQRAEEVFAFRGASVLFRTEALRDAGVFDDDFFTHYEDTDLAWRLRSRGWSVRYLPEAVVRHVHAASSGEWSPFLSFHVDRNRLLMLTKSASAGLALREVLRYPLTTASLALRTVARAHPRRPPRGTLLRLRVMASYLRLLPAMLARRWEISRHAKVDRRHLERWLVLR